MSKLSDAIVRILVLNPEFQIPRGAASASWNPILFEARRKAEFWLYRKTNKVHVYDCGEMFEHTYPDLNRACVDMGVLQRQLVTHAGKTMVSLIQMPSWTGAGIPKIWTNDGPDELIEKVEKQHLAAKIKHTTLEDIAWGTLGDLTPEMEDKLRPYMAKLIAAVHKMRTADTLKAWKAIAKLIRKTPEAECYVQQDETRERFVSRTMEGSELWRRWKSAEVKPKEACTLTKSECASLAATLSANIFTVLGYEVPFTVESDGYRRSDNWEVRANKCSFVIPGKARNICPNWKPEDDQIIALAIRGTFVPAQADPPLLTDAETAVSSV